MTDHLAWQDVAQIERQLSNADKKLLLLLARLPFLSVELAMPLLSLEARRSLDRRAWKLREQGLIGSIRPVMRPGPIAQLMYLMDPGLAVVALALNIGVRELAHRLRLRRNDLLARLLVLSPLLATYKLLGIVAASRPGRRALLAWVSPWRARCYRPTVKAPIHIQMPAYAAFAWEDACAEYLLVPDLAKFPVHTYRRLLNHLSLWQRMQQDNVPPLIIATPYSGRAAVWETLLEEVRRTHVAAPLTACVLTWDELPNDVSQLREVGSRPRSEARRLIQWVHGSSLSPKPNSRQIPAVIGATLLEATNIPKAPRLGRLSLSLTATDYAVLDLVARHPFLTVGDLAAIMRWTPRWTREQCNRLINQGMVRLLDNDEVGAKLAGRGLAELTEDGLTLAAAQQGLSLASAVRFNGFVGGGPDHPAGARRKLVQTLCHTLGANAVFISLYRAAQYRQVRGHDDAVIEWRSAAACSSRVIRPDGYGIYRYDGKLFGFFVEYDRATMNTRQYYAKFAAYYAYLERRLFEREFDGMPIVLVVTTNATAQNRLMRVVEAVAVGRQHKLPLLVTCEWRLHNLQNPNGLLGRIWCRPDAHVSERSSWPVSSRVTDSLKS